MNSFSRNEIIELGIFLKSPFFNKRSDVIKFYDNFIRNIPLNSINRQKIYFIVYGAAKYNEQVIVNLFSRTRKLIFRYLTIKGLEKDDTANTYALAFELAKKNQTAMTEKAINSALLNLKNEFYTVEFLKKYYDYTELKESFLSIRNFKQKSANALRRGEAAVNYSIINLLRIANDFIVYKYVNSVTENEETFNGFFKYFDFEKYLANLKTIGSEYYAITAVFYYGLESKMYDPKGKYRDILKKIVFENLENMKYQDQATCWTMLFASYIFTNTPPAYDVSPEVHEINKHFISKDIYTRDELGFMFENNYHNIAIQAINAKDYLWAEKFLNDYKGRLNPNIPDDTYISCMARIEFEKKNFERCLNFLSRMKIDNIMTKMNLSVLLIRCHYELGFYEEALSALEALSQFHKKNKVLTTNLKKNFEGFLKFTKKLILFKSSGKKLPEEIYLKVLKVAAFNNKKWVIEKMEQLL